MASPLDETCSERSALGSLGSFWPLSKLAAAAPSANIYQQLGVRPVINCMGAWTVMERQAVAPSYTLLCGGPRVNLCFSKSCRKKLASAIEAHRLGRRLW